MTLHNYLVLIIMDNDIEYIENSSFREDFKKGIKKFIKFLWQTPWMLYIAFIFVIYIIMFLIFIFA